jgi:U6 snRNA-associated Sm-like protein LSm6
MEFADAKTEAAPSSSGVAKKNPTEFLKQVIGKPVVVKLNSGVTYRGVLACLDGFMNIAMEQTEEYIDGQLKNRYGDCFIRGNNGKSFFPFLLCPFFTVSSITIKLLLFTVLYISAAKAKK